MQVQKTLCPILYGRNVHLLEGLSISIVKV